MGVLQLREGQVFSLNGQVMTLIKEIGEKDLLLRSDRGEDFLKTREDLFNSYINDEITSNKNYKESRYLGKIKEMSLSADFTPGQLACIKRRLAYVKDAMNITFGILLTSQIKKTHIRIQDDISAPCNSSVWAWKKRYIESNFDPVSLLPKVGNKGKHARFGDEELELIQKFIWSHYLNELRPTVEATVREINKRIDKINETQVHSDQLKHITRCIFERILKENHTPYEIDLRRRGRDYVTAKYRGVTRSAVNYQQALYMGAMDHTLLDLIIVDESGRLLMRPWITILICSSTRCILGFYLGFTPPSDISITKCLKHSLLPKLDLQKKYPEIKNEWLAFGPLSNMKLDNAFEFHSHTFERICGEIETKMIFCPRKQAWFKAEIERFIKSQNQFIHLLDGTTFSNPKDKGDYRSEKKACLTLENLTFLINKWIVDVYHQTPHGGLNNRTPHDMWQILVDQKNIALVTDLGDIDYLLAKSTSRVVEHRGVSIYNQWYNSSDLIQLRKECGDKFKTTIRYSEEDLGCIWVVHPYLKEYYLRVPAVNQKYCEGLSKFQHKINVDYALKKGYGNSVISFQKASLEIYGAIAKEDQKLGPRVARYTEKNSITESSSSFFEQLESDYEASFSDNNTLWNLPKFNSKIVGAE